MSPKVLYSLYCHKTATLAEQADSLNELYELTARHSEEVVGINRAICSLTQAKTIEETCAILIRVLAKEFNIQQVVSALGKGARFVMSLPIDGV